MEFVILSNNASLEEKTGGIEVRRIDGSLNDFYAALESALQNGYRLVTAILPPNVPLIRSPVRSVILAKAGRKYDAAGLLALEKARERSVTLGVRDNERIRKDLEYIDRDHLLAAIGQLGELAALIKLEEGGRNC